MAAIHHQPGTEAGLAELGRRCLNSLKVIVAAAVSAPQNQMAIRISGGTYDRGMAIAVDAEEVVRLGGRLHGIDRNAGAAIRSVLVADRHREP